MDSLEKTSKFHFKGDKILLIIVFVLTALSTLLVYSTGGKEVLTHIIHLSFCYAALVFFYFLDYRILGAFAPLILLVSIALLILTLLSDAVRGIVISGHSFQTFYLIGFGVIIYVSHYIARHYKNGDELNKNELIHLFGITLLFTICMAKLNNSTAIIFFVTCMVMFFVANIKSSYLLTVLGGLVVMGGLLALLVFVNVKAGNDVQIGRMSTLVNRIEYYFTKDNSQHYGDQMVLSRAAIARGGFHPAGPGKGVIKNRLPENNTDYAFASIYEETGIVVGLLIILSYIIFLYRAREISKNAGGPFGKLLAFGIGFWLTCQAFVHIGVNCSLLPATGQTLPFISSGGASLGISGAAVGILLNISKIDAKHIAKNTVKPKFVRGDETTREQ